MSLPAASIKPYPQGAAERDRWVLSQRAARQPLDPHRPVAVLREEERAESGEVVPVATVFLANRECPWRCVMCDLWKNTLPDVLPPGAIPRQIDEALASWANDPHPPRQIKLYNSGSFFDAGAVLPDDHAAIAERVRGFERVIVECHPALVGGSALRFRDRIRGRLEVAMGLETVDPDVLPRLNKGMTLDQFAQAASFLRVADIALRAFILVQPPFQAPEQALPWAGRSVEFAFDCGATAAVLIPTRFGNGSLEALARAGDFASPALELLEAATEQGIALRRGRVFADLWDLPAFARCAACARARRDRLERMNWTQAVEPAVVCASCQPDPL